MLSILHFLYLLKHYSYTVLSILLFLHLLDSVLITYRYIFPATMGIRILSNPHLGAYSGASVDGALLADI